MVSFVLDIDHYGIGLETISIEYTNNSESIQVINLVTFVTNIGYIYIESLFYPEITGYYYTIISLQVTDYVGKVATFTESQLKKKFGFSGFTLHPTIPQDSNFFEYTLDDRNPKISYANRITNLIAYVNLNSPFYPLSCIHGIGSMCTTLF